jgi:predicted ABC-type ATPase
MFSTSGSTCNTGACGRRRRYQRSLDNLLRVLPLLDRLEIYDNTDTLCRVVEFQDQKLTIDPAAPERVKKVLARVKRDG